MPFDDLCPDRAVAGISSSKVRECTPRGGGAKDSLSRHDARCNTVQQLRVIRVPLPLSILYNVFAVHSVYGRNGGTLDHHPQHCLDPSSFEAFIDVGEVNLGRIARSDAQGYCGSFAKVRLAVFWNRYERRGTTPAILLADTNERELEVDEIVAGQDR